MWGKDNLRRKMCASFFWFYQGLPFVRWLAFGPTNPSFSDSWMRRKPFGAPCNSTGKCYTWTTTQPQQERRKSAQKHQVPVALFPSSGFSGALPLMGRGCLPEVQHPSRTYKVTLVAVPLEWIYSWNCSSQKELQMKGLWFFHELSMNFDEFSRWVWSCRCLTPHF